MQSVRLQANVALGVECGVSEMHDSLVASSTVSSPYSVKAEYVGVCIGPVTYAVYRLSLSVWWSARNAVTSRRIGTEH